MRKRNTIIVQATAPSHWASYLINGDGSSLTDGERAQADAFADWIGGDIINCTDAGFMWHHDAMHICGAWPAFCQTYEAIVTLTPVIFRLERGGSILAVFPTIAAAPGQCACYSHFGQHSGMVWDYMRDTRPVLPDAPEVKALRRELENLGYRLKVYQRKARWMKPE